jgi:hypothetical protein
LVYTDPASDRNIVADMDVATDHHVIGHGHSVADPYIMAQVDVRHQEIVVADFGDTGFFFAGTIDRDILSNNISVANDYLGVGTLITHVLRFGADHSTWENVIPFADCRITTKGDMILDDCIATDFHARSDDAEVADVNAGTDLRAGIDDCGCGDLSAHLSGDLLGLIIKS